MTSFPPGVRTQTLIVHIHPEHRVGGLGGLEAGGRHHNLTGDVRLRDILVAVEDPDDKYCSQTTAKLHRLGDLGNKMVCRSSLMN